MPPRPDNADRRLRVLLLAEACNPQWTSVPLLAYYWYKALCKNVEVTLVTQIRNQSGFREHGDDLSRIVFIDSEAVAAPLYRLGNLLTMGHPTALGARGAISWPAYLYYEHLVWKRFRDDLIGGKYDLVHRLSPISPTVPSPIAQRCPVPFVLGPLNGALPWSRYSKEKKFQEGEVLSPLRSIYRALPYVRQTYERASLILAANRYTKSDLPYRTQRRSMIVAENGVDTDSFRHDNRALPSKVDPFTILFVGRLVPFKQPAIILEAVARLGPVTEKIRIVYVGDGPERTAIRAQVQKQGLTKQVTLMGNVPHHELARHYQSASVFVLPSVHESGGAVLLEAMACGLPCVVVNYGGPSEYVNDATGVRIPLGTHQEMSESLTRVIRDLYNNRSQLDTFSAAARDRVVNQYAWDVKGQKLAHLYRQLVSSDNGCMTRDGES